MIFNTVLGYVSKQGEKYYFSEKPNTNIVVQFDWLEIPKSLASTFINQQDKFKNPIYADSAKHLLSRIRKARGI